MTYISISELLNIRQYIFYLYEGEHEENTM